MRKDWVRFYDERIRPLLDKHYGNPEFNRMMKKVFPDQIWFDKGDINYVQSHDNKVYGRRCTGSGQHLATDEQSKE